ncbi:phage minor tail protein L [Pseudodesulfovibrio sp. JC047]|uniref:phage minor tail protein L n=1 Tax=Pseudodesulfovibrio sp. JC047 TaxID=2683199 RepID=UPI0013D2C563|nr:phage minor tail protein L [Pseudodesulfovibrio sp. JC047]NDV19995.1 phage minor tail protein L [Pseudodesulfovibrio sp. JC047]
MINSDVQKASPGNLVHLFDIDATGIGGDVYHFVKATDQGQPVRWRGNVYMPLDFEGEGFEVNGQGSLPRPTLRVSHIKTALLGVVRESGDLLGAEVTRWRTFSKYLDGGPQADPNVHFPPDIYNIDRKIVQNKVFIEWELAASMDQEGKKLPGRQILRDTCTHIYRRWTGCAFDYSKATCPYTGGGCFDRAGKPCLEGEDQCGKRLSDCELRFPHQPLPTRAFPGVARTRA